MVSVFYEVLSLIQSSIDQVGEFFLHFLNDMPLFHKVVLSSHEIDNECGWVLVGVAGF